MQNLAKDIDAILITGRRQRQVALAVKLAQRHGGVVINADSMQVYGTLKVLTARPDESEMGGVEHFLYGHVPPAGPIPPACGSAKRKRSWRG